MHKAFTYYIFRRPQMTKKYIKLTPANNSTPRSTSKTQVSVSSSLGYVHCSDFVFKIKLYIFGILES